MSNKTDLTTKTNHITRRAFLHKAALSGTGLIILVNSRSVRSFQANEKLNIACIGVGGRGAADVNGVRDENIVALCDVDETHIDNAAKEFPTAQRYVDWRKCLDQKDIDAVVCSTTDFTHAHVANWAINRGSACTLPGSPAT